MNDVADAAMVILGDEPGPIAILPDGRIIRMNAVIWDWRSAAEFLRQKLGYHGMVVVVH